MSTRTGSRFRGMREATIYSHDTSCSSTGYVVNGHHAYGFGDADRAVNQPKLVPSLLLGVAWRP